MDRAALVVLRLGSSPGLMWEFKTMAASVPPERILLYLEPPGQPPEKLWRLLPCSQTGPSWGRYIHFSSDWTPHAGQILRITLDKAGLVRIRTKDSYFSVLGYLSAIGVFGFIFMLGCFFGIGIFIYISVLGCIGTIVGLLRSP